MHEFDYTKLNNRTWDNETLEYIAKIHEYKGKQGLFTRQKPVQLERMVEIAKIQSTEASNRIEGIVTTDARLKQLVEDKTTPRNRSEEEILGYRNVLSLIHENYHDIPLTPNYILQLHKMMLQYTPSGYGGKFKMVPNDIEQFQADGTTTVLFVPLEPALVPGAMEDICNSYKMAIQNEVTDELILIPSFILDFLCIHPFTDGNGRMSRLLTLLLLYQSGYDVGKYVSVEKAIADTKIEYYAALAASDQGWHENKNDMKPFIRYILGIILKCYRDFEDRVILEEKTGVRSTSLDIVRKYAEGTIGTFTKRDAMIACPSLGSSSVESALKKLVEDGTLRRVGSGRKTQYVKS